MTHDTAHTSPEEFHLDKSSSWLINSLGVVLIVAGFAAIAFPLISSLGVTFCIAWLLIVAAIVQSIYGFNQIGWRRIAMSLVVAALWLVSGLFLLLRPLEGLAVLTVFVAAAFLLEGIIKAIFYFEIRDLPKSGWILFDALAAIFLGALMWWQFPVSALWALGTLAGVNIMISGWTLVIAPKLIESAIDSANAVLK